MPIHDQVWLHHWGCELTSRIVRVKKGDCVLNWVKDDEKM